MKPDGPGTKRRPPGVDGLRVDDYENLAQEARAMTSFSLNKIFEN